MHIGRYIILGIMASLLAGVIYTSFLFMGNMSLIIADAFGLSEISGVLAVHFLIGVLAGIFFVFCFGWLIESWFTALSLGLLFGLGLWIMGPMTLLPYLAKGIGLFANWTPAGIHQNLMLLFGHLFYGALTACVYYLLKKNLF